MIFYNLKSYFQHVWKIKRCGDDQRLCEVPYTDEKDIEANHVTATWSYPQKLFVLTKKGTFYMIDMAKDITYGILSDMLLEKVMKEEGVPGNAFLRAYHEDLILVLNKTILILNISTYSNLLLKASSMKKIYIGDSLLNLHDFHSGFRFVGYTPNVRKFHNMAQFEFLKGIFMFGSL